MRSSLQMDPPLSTVPFAISKMKFSELIPLKEGVFLLEEGDGQWPPNQCETVVIQFAGSETRLAAQRFEDDDEVL